MPGDALDVFISYSHEDETLRQELEEHLVRLRSEGLVRAWHERQITAGEEWRGWIDRDLLSSDLILLVVSEPFLASAYCQDAEIKHALERHASGQAQVIPIIARPCDWRTAPFSGLSALPRGVGPVTEWHTRDGAWEDVVEGIREVAALLRAARDAVLLEGTAEYRGAAVSALRGADRLAAVSPEEAPEARTSRWAVLGGFAAAATALAALWLIFVVWQRQQSEPGIAPMPAGEVTSLADKSRRSSPAGASAAMEQPSAPPPPAETLQKAETDATEVTSSPAVRASPGEGLPEEAPSEMETSPEEPAPVTPAETVPAVLASVDRGEDVGPPEPAVEPRKPEDFERSLGILAIPGGEGEGDCVAVLVADQYALTSRACAQASSVVVMGGNALTATRDEIFDLEPWQSTEPTDVNIVKLIQRLEETYGFVSTRLEESFDHESLDAYYVESAAIRHAECSAETHLAEMDGNGRAYIENAAFDRYVRFVEEAADEAISVAGSQWATLLSDVLGSAEQPLAGFVCRIPHGPPRNLVFSAEGSVVGIGYSCEPFDRLEPEVRDSLPTEIRGLDLDCLASLSKIREELRDLRTSVTDVSR
ncbi:MAG: TIR domain-containing protein [bacterium]|nr:TIR domain-containing protein [bacterium]